MKLNLNLLIDLFCVLNFSNFKAQNHLLDSLTTASMEELDPSKEIMIDGITIPIFSLDGKQLSQDEIMQQFSKGDVAPDFYIDDNKDIKAIVLRKATKEEMEMMMMSPPKESIETGSIGIPFSATDLDGNVFSFAELKGTVVVINFWFVACNPWVAAIP